MICQCEGLGVEVSAFVCSRVSVRRLLLFRRLYAVRRKFFAKVFKFMSQSASGFVGKRVSQVWI